MPRLSAHFIALTAVVAALAAATPGCASATAHRADDGAAASARPGALGPRINACAVLRSRYRGQRPRLDRLESEYETLRQLLTNHGAASSPMSLPPKGGSSPNVHHVSLTVDYDGMRISGKAATWSDVQQFAKAANAGLYTPMVVARARVGGDHMIAFTLVDRSAVSEPRLSSALAAAIFPPRNGRSLQEYAQKLCEFGSNEPVKLQAGVSALATKDLGESTRGAWTRHTLRAQFAADSGFVGKVISQANDLAGVSIHEIDGHPSADIYRAHLSDTFDASTWLNAQLDGELRSRTPLSTPPPTDKLITWRKKGGFPEGVSRSLLGSTSWYYFSTVDNLYQKVVADWTQQRLADAIGRQQSRALRGALCLLRADAAAAAHLDDSLTRTVHAAKLDFRVAAPGHANASIDRVEMDAGGAMRWRLAAGDGQHFAAAQRAFRGCLGVSKLDDAIADADGTSHWTGEATASARGLYVPLGAHLDPPRFADARAYVDAAAKGRGAPLRAQLRSLRASSTWQQAMERAAKLVPNASSSAALIGRLGELSRQHHVELASLKQRSMLNAEWNTVRPWLVDLHATGTPADVLAFVADLFDLPQALVPARLVLTPTDHPDTVQLDATVHAFYQF